MKKNTTKPSKHILPSGALSAVVLVVVLVYLMSWIVIQRLLSVVFVQDVLKE